MGFTQDLFTSRRNYSDGASRVGQTGRIWYDHDTNSFRIGDGVTPGGSVINVSHITTTGIGISVDQSTGNVVFTSNATHLNIPNTIVARNGDNVSNIGTINATNIKITGNLTVFGQTTYVQQQTLALVDHQIVLSNVAIPTDAAADGGGVILKGNVDHTFLWDRTSNTWTSSESISVNSGRTYKINGVNVLTNVDVLDSSSSANIATSGTIVRIGATTGNTIVRNNLIVDGSTSFGNIISGNIISTNIDVSGNALVGKSLTVIGDTNFAGNLNAGTTTLTGVIVSGPATVGSNLLISGNSTIGGRLSVVGDTTLTGNLSAANTNLDSLAVTDAVTMGNSLQVSGESTLASVTISNLTSGRIAIVGSGGSLNDSSNFTFNTGNNTFYTVNAAFAGSLTVTANSVLGTLIASDTVLSKATVSTTLLVSGATTLSSTLSAGNTTVDNIIINGNASVSSDLLVSGTTSLIGNVTARNIQANTISLSNNATISSTLAVGGNLSVAGSRFTINAADGSTYVGNLLTVNGNLAVNGSNLDVISSTFHLAPTVTDLRIGESFGITRVRNNLDVNGDLNFDGGYITAGTIAVNVLNTNQIVNAFTSATVLNLGDTGAQGTTSVQNSMVVVGNLTVNGINLNVTSTTFNLASTATDLRIGQTFGTTRIRNNLDIGGNVNFTGTNFTSNSSSLNILPTNQTINAFTGATILNLGDTAGVGDTNIQNSLVVVGNLTVNGSNLNVGTSSFNLAPTVSDLRIGQSFGTTRIRNNLDIGGNVNFTGTNFTSTSSSLSILPTNQTVNAFSSASTLNLGNVDAIGTTTIQNNLFVVGNLEVNGQSVTYNSAVAVVADPVIVLGGPPPAASNDNKDRGIQFTWHTGSSPRTGFFGWDVSSQAFTVIPDANNVGEIFVGTPGSAIFDTITGTLGLFSGNFSVNGTAFSTTSSQFNLLNNAATTVNFAGAATNIEIGASTGITNINNNLDVDGNINIDGGNITTSATTFNLVNTAATTINFGLSATSLTFAATSGITNIRNNVDIDLDLNIDGGDLTTNSSSFNLLNSTATTINFAGSATVLNLGAITGNTSVRNNLDVDGDINIDGGDITTSASVFNVVTTSATTINFGLSATSLTFAATSGITNIRNSLDIDLDLNIDGGDLTTNSSSFNLLMNNATTINAFGAATLVNLGSATGTTNIKNKLDVDGNVNIDGNYLTTSGTTFNLINTTATTVNAAGQANSIILGAVTGTTNIRHNLVVDLDLAINGGDLTTSSSSFNLLTTNASAINAFGAASVINLGSNSGLTNIKHNLDVDGTVNIDGGILSTNSASFTLFNLNATNVSAFAAATNLQFGATTGTTFIRNNLDVTNNVNVSGSLNIDTNLVVDGSVNIDGSVDVDNSVDIQNNLTVGGNFVLVGSLTIGSPGFNSTSLTFNLLNTFSQTINAFGDATTVNIGNTNGITNVNHNLEVKGQSLTTNKTTFNLLNTTATTLNFAGAATALNIGATSGLTNIRNNLQVDLDLDIRGGDITTNQTSFNLLNTTASTVNAFGDATTLNLAAATGLTNVRNNLSVGGNVTIVGDLTVNGTVTTVNSSTLTVDDKNIELGSITTPTDVTADGGGITLRGTTQKTINWLQSTNAWTSSEHFDIATGKEYRINNVLLANTSTLGSTVLYSRLTQVGTISTGIWQGSVINPTYGGTGVNNGSKTITLGGNFQTAGNFNLQLILTGASSLTLPTTGTVATLAGTETLTNKTISLTNNTLSGTLAEFNTALTGADFASLAGNETLTNKTVNLTNNTLLGTRAQFNSAVSDGEIGFTSGNLSQFAATTSAELASVLTDETGTGRIVLNTDAIITTPNITQRTTTVTGATYSLAINDFYVGVNRAGPVTITLPVSVSNGRIFYIKDESGQASINPITVAGTIDNDMAGIVIQQDNGGVQLIYSNSSWRII